MSLRAAIAAGRRNEARQLRARANPAKGWTKADADDRVALRKMANIRSPMQERVEFDAFWNEWVIITVYPGAPTTMHRKPRQGLKHSYRVI